MEEVQFFRHRAITVPGSLPQDESILSHYYQ
jgi:hypothetical protein